MKWIIASACLIGAVVFVQPNAFAWGSAGHMVIAAEAFRALTPETKAECFEALKAHPDFAKWTNAYHPNTLIDMPAYVFMRSSTWPDEIRRSGNPYDHPNWHFIDYPLRPPGFAFEPDARPTDNILYGIGQCEATLSDTNANPELRAASLSYLVHFVGDLHQPLHCESFFSDAYPKGDKGGNDFYVRPDQRAVRLHGIWDGLLGGSVNPQTQWKYALAIEAEFPQTSLPELTTNTTPKAWSLESRQLAIEKGYLRGELKGSAEVDSAPPLPEGYTKAAKAVAERQGALAGYRLAYEIEKYLKCGIAVPLLPANTNIVVQNVPKKISAAEANRYYNETMVVTGIVAAVSTRATVALFNLDKPYPETPFTAVVFAENFGRFGNLKEYQGKSVEITGDVTEYRNKPEIIMESPDQIKVVDGK